MVANSDIKSIIKNFSLGKIRNDILFPFTSISDEELLNLNILNENLVSFLENNVNAKRIDSEDNIPRTLIQNFADIGIFSVAVPEEYDGYGFSNFSYLKVMEIIGSYSLSLAASIGIATSISMKTIERFATEKIKQKLLKNFTSGESIIAFAFSEEEAGSDLNSVNTKASLSEDRDFYIINGTKKYVTNADIANYYIILAKTAVDIRGRMRERLSAFLIPHDTPGLALGKKLDKFGLRGLNVFGLTLKNVKIPRQNIIGRAGQGFDIAYSVLSDGRVAQAASCLGVMKKMYNLALGYSKQRKQFGKAIFDFELIQKKLIKMNTDIFVAESIIYLTAGLMNRFEFDYSAEASICKIFTTEALWDSVNIAMQIVGGKAYMNSEDYQLYLRDARAQSIINGTNEILRLSVAMEGLRLPRTFLHGLRDIISNPIKNPTGVMKELYKYASQRIGRALPVEILPKKGIQILNRLIEEIETLNYDAGKSEQVRALEKSIRDLANNLETFLIKHGQDLLSKQYQLERIANILIDIYASTSIISHCQKLITIKGEGKSSTEKVIVTLFISDALKRIEKNLSLLSNNNDNLRKTVKNYMNGTDEYNLGLAKYNFIHTNGTKL